MSRYDQDPAGSAYNWPPGSGSVIQEDGSADPDSNQIFRDPQHRTQGGW